MAARTEREREEDKIKARSRTCCDICHIKFGTIFLGVVEAMVAVVVLVTAIQQLSWKSQHSTLCNQKGNYFGFLRDCLIFQYSHFNVTVIFDYIVVLMVVFILLTVLLMMCGILSDTSCLLLPHLVIQAIFLLFSIGYFFLYAWSYFYGDLYLQHKKFKMSSFIERMWLASMLLVLAGLQTYLFSTVIRCSMYLSGVEEARRHRASAFERCSQRVRLAKENGLWRTTSWGGGFQQYIGQYDDDKPKKTKDKKFHVQFKSDNMVVVDEDCTDETPMIKPSPPRKPSPPEIIPLDEPPRYRRASQLSEESIHFLQNEARAKSDSSSNGKRPQSESPKKERPHKSLQKTSSEGSGSRRLSEEDVYVHHTHHHKDNDGKHAVLDMRRTPQKIEVVKEHRKDRDHQHHHNHHDVPNRPSTSASPVKIEVQKPSEVHDKKETLRQNSSQSHTAARREITFHMKTYKSFDSEAYPDPPSPTEKKSGRRRSSAEEPPLVVTHHIKGVKPDRKHHDVVKKVSITSTQHPFQIV